MDPGLTAHSRCADTVPDIAATSACSRHPVSQMMAKSLLRERIPDELEA
jgi:hypothetical protein